MKYFTSNPADRQRYYAPITSQHTSVTAKRVSVQSISRLILLTILSFSGVAFSGIGSLTAQDQSGKPEKLELKIKGAVQIDPRGFEFSIPPGELYAAADRRVIVRDNDNEKKVAKVHVQVGDNFICLLPDGRLKDFEAAEVELTQDPFKPATGKEIADQLTAGHFKGFKVKHTSRYVYIYNTSDKFVEGTSRVIESMMRGVIRYAKNQRIDVHEPEVPLIITMFRTERQYQEYKEIPPGMVAYYNILNNQVVLCEETPLARINPDLALKQTISTIAHEGAHQILHNIGVQQRLAIWPMWLTEGMAEFYAPTDPGRDLKWKGAGKVNDFRMFELESYLASKSDLTLDGNTTRETIKAARLNSAGYASAWSLVHYLDSRERKQFNALISELSQLHPLQGFTGRDALIDANEDLFIDNFGDDWADLEEELVKHLKRQNYRSPFADYPHYVAMVIYRENGKPMKRVNTFLSESSAGEWYGDFVRSLPDGSRNTADGRIQRFPNRAAAANFCTGWLKQ